MPQIPITVRDADAHPIVQVVNIQLPDPVTGTGTTYTVPVGYRMQLITFNYTFIADATVANRNPIFQIICNNVIVFTSETYPPVTAGASAAYTLSQGGATRIYTVVSGLQSMPLPSGLTMQEGDMVRILALNQQATDTFTLITMQAISQYVAG